LKFRGSKKETLMLNIFDLIDGFTSIRGGEGVPISVIAVLWHFEPEDGKVFDTHKTEKLIQKSLNCEDF